MPKDKERSVNPAQAQRKLEKQKAVKKGKAEAVARRNEKLARRNPERIQRQINDLKAIEESGQPLRPREKQVLEELERDLRAVQKAREALGDKAPQFAHPSRYSGAGGAKGNGSGGDHILGKRRREDARQRQWRHESDGSDTDESVRNIPMPRDTPPPIPQEFRRRRRDFHHHTAGAGEDLQPDDNEGPRRPHALPAKPEGAAVVRPPPQPRTVYESAPVIRDLRKEAVRKFVPAAVRKQQEAIRGQGRLVEPEEMDRLERAGYVPQAPGKYPTAESNKDTAAADDDNDDDDPEVILRRIEQETRLISTDKSDRRERLTVEMEEVTDEDEL